MLPCIEHLRQRGTRHYREIHASNIRIGSLHLGGKSQAQNLSFTCVSAIHKEPESAGTFKRMFVDDTNWHDSFMRHFENTYGFDEHYCAMCNDGGATPHHTGHGGSACTFGCWVCTRHRDLKHVIKADIDPTNTAALAGLGVDRTYEQTTSFMESFEDDLRAEMVARKAHYIKKCDNSEERYNEWCQLHKGQCRPPPLTPSLPASPPSPPSPLPACLR